MRFALRPFAPFAALLMLASACAKRYPISGAPPPPADENSGGVFYFDVPLHVESRYSSDFVVYVLSGGIRTRLGTTSGPSSRTFAIPKRVFDGVSQIRLVAELIGGPVSGSGERTAISSGALAVRPGQRIEWVLESVSGSAVSIY